MSETGIKEKAAAVAGNTWAQLGTVVALVCALVSGFNKIVDLSYQAGQEKQRLDATAAEVEKHKAAAVLTCEVQNKHTTAMAVHETTLNATVKGIERIEGDMKAGFRTVNESVNACQQRIEALKK